MLVYLDPSVRLTTSDIAPYLKQAAGPGILAWKLPSELPTSTFTHEKMFTYFNTKKDNYFFHHMVEPNNLIVYNTEKIHKNLMLPWLQCTLTFHCITPIGAQDTGCNYDHRPMFRYSGCHSYDSSALNVALGLMFKFSYSDYLGNATFYRHVKPGEPVMTGQDSSGMGTTKSLYENALKSVSNDAGTND